MSDTPKKNIHKIMKLITLAMVVLFTLLLVLVGGLLLWLRSDSANKMIAEQLTAILKEQGLYLSLEELSGPLPGSLRLKKVELADEQGVWLRFDELNVEIALLDLLSGTINVELIVLNKPELIRLPDLPASEQEPQPAEFEGGFDLNLPFDIKLGELLVKDANIAWPVLGISKSSDENLLTRATAYPLMLNLKTNANLSQGVAEAKLETNLQAGDLLGLQLVLESIKLNKSHPSALGLLLKADASVNWEKRNDKLAISANINQNDSLWQVNEFKVNGLGLKLSSNAEFEQNTSHIKASLKLNSPENADWQSLASGLAGLEQSFINAVGNPLSIELNLENSESGIFSLDLNELRAGVISGQGKASAHFPENNGLPNSEPGSVDANISVQISDLAPLSPQFGGSLKTNLKASGNFELANIDLSVSSPKLLAPGGEINDLALNLTAALRNIMDDNPSGSGRLKTSSSSMPGVSNDLIAVEADWQLALNVAQGSEKGSAQVEKLYLQAFGLNVQGELKADMGHAFFAEKATSDAIWPNGLALNGNLALKVDDWRSLAQLSGMQIAGNDVNAQVQLVNNNGTQNAKLDLAAKSLAIPEQGVRISDLLTKADAKLAKNTPDILFDLTTAKSMAGPLEWASLNVNAEGNSGKGQFRLSMVELPAPPPQKNKTPASSKEELITLAGSYDLSNKEIELNSLHAKYPGSKVSVAMRNPASFSYGNGLELKGLNLDISPSGNLTADSRIKPGILNIQAKITDVPFATINALASTTLPPGRLDANIDFKSPSQGSLTAELRLNKKAASPAPAQADQSGRAEPAGLASPASPAGPVDSTAKAPPAPAPHSAASTLAPENLDAERAIPRDPDIVLKADLGRSSGKFALTGGIDFNTLTGNAFSNATPSTSTNSNTSAQPITFSVPLLLDSSGIPMPDMNGAFRADMVWMGEITPLWQLVPMPDRDFSGLASINLHLNGSLNSPKYNGGAYIAAGRFEDRELGVMLSDIKLEAHAASQKEFRMVLTATDGDKGKLGFEGSINPNIASALNLRGRIEHLSPIHRDDINLTITGLLAVNGPFSQPNVNVQTIIEEGEITLLDSLMSGSVSTLDISTPESEIKEHESGANLNVSVEIPHRFYIRGRGLDSEWQGKLNITGPSSAPEIKGNLNPVRGQLNLLSRNFNITQGNIEFVGGTRINPGLNLVLTYSSSSLEAIVRLGGSLDHPSLAIESSPPMPQDEVLAQVLFGKNVSDLSRFEALQLASGLRSLTSGGSSFKLLADIRETTGLDVLRVGASGDSQQKGPQATGQSGSSNLTPTGGSNGGDTGQGGDATLEAGKYLNDSIYIGVEKGASQENTAVRVEIELFPRVTLQGTTSPDSSQVGIGWKKDY